MLQDSSLESNVKEPSNSVSGTTPSTPQDKPVAPGLEHTGEHLPNVVVAAELVTSIAEACALSDRPMKINDFIEYTGKNPRSINEAIKAAVWLKLIELGPSGYLAPSTVRSRFPAGKERKALLFVEYLQQKKSFVQFSTFLDYGDDSSLASRKVKVLYKIDVASETVLDLFGGWGKSAGVFQGTNQSLRLKPEFHASDLPTEYLKDLKEALENDMRARVFINRKLTEETFRAVPPVGIDRAVRAIRGIRLDPRNSVEDAGELLEDYLRLKAKSDGVDASGAMGIGGVIKVLGDKLIDEHRSVGGAINTLRIMASHPTRAVTERRWELKPDSGLEAVLLSLSLMRSIDEYDRSKRTVF
jgi:hypothetical protein